MPIERLKDGVLREEAPVAAEAAREVPSESVLGREKSLEGKPADSPASLGSPAGSRVSATRVDPLLNRCDKNTDNGNADVGAFRVDVDAADEADEDSLLLNPEDTEDPSTLMTFTATSPASDEDGGFATPVGSSSAEEEEEEENTECKTPSPTPSDQRLLGDHDDPKAEADTKVIGQYRGPNRKDCGEVLVPIQDDEREHVSLNTVSVHSGPSTPSMEGSGHVQATPLLPLSTTAASVGTQRHGPANDDAIQVEMVPPGCLSRQVSVSKRPAYYDCSPGTMCGPHPKKMVVVIAVVLSIWASFVLALHVQKTIGGVGSKVEMLTQKLIDLETSYSQLQKNTGRRIEALKQKLQELQVSIDERKDRQGKERGRSDLQVAKSLAKKIASAGTKAASETKPMATTVTASPELSCVTTRGRPCIFPFSHGGQEHHGCLDNFMLESRWCPTEITSDGLYVDGFEEEGTTWGLCAESAACPNGN